MISFYSYRTLRSAVSYFRFARAQGYSPSLLAVADGWRVPGLEAFMKTTEHCAGCRQNFYNGNNPLGVKRCWNLDTARLVKRIVIGVWQNPPFHQRVAWQFRQKR